ncbi:hypothetical protein NMY22_g1621 [Coprinellus aureogranulatus]|nr:hypothetical protein NMY22_g1621 [Coprinellus aureogranulatus]
MRGNNRMAVDGPPTSKAGPPPLTQGKPPFIAFVTTFAISLWSTFRLGGSRVPFFAAIDALKWPVRPRCKPPYHGLVSYSGTGALAFCSASLLPDEPKLVQQAFASNEDLNNNGGTHLPLMKATHT